MGAMGAWAPINISHLIYLSHIMTKRVQSGVKITVGHRLKTKQFNKIAAHFLVWSEIFQIKEGWVYTAVLTAYVVIVADINNICTICPMVTLLANE